MTIFYELILTGPFYSLNFFFSIFCILLFFLFSSYHLDPFSLHPVAIISIGIVHICFCVCHSVHDLVYSSSYYINWYMYMLIIIAEGSDLFSGGGDGVTDLDLNLIV